METLEFSKQLQEWGFYFQMVGSTIEIKEIRKGTLLMTEKEISFDVAIWHEDLFEAFIEGVEEQHLETGQTKITDFYLYCKAKE